MLLQVLIDCFNSNKPLLSCSESWSRVVASDVWVSVSVAVEDDGVVTADVLSTLVDSSVVVTEMVEALKAIVLLVNESKVRWMIERTYVLCIAHVFVIKPNRFDLGNKKLKRTGAGGSSCRFRVSDWQQRCSWFAVSLLLFALTSLTAT